MASGTALLRARLAGAARVVDPSWATFRAVAAAAANRTPSSESIPHPQGVSLSRLPGLDGLRAVAVIAVLLYHADLGILPGGFLGVDVFFVISGYLITALLLREWEASRSIRVRAFWFRRARRLLPALFTLLGVTIVFAVAFLPGELARLRADALAAFGYVTNWYLIVQHQSYFEAVGRPSLLRHLWSLAVEEQFYLVWPLALLAGLALLRRRALLAVVVITAALSALWMAALYVPETDPSRVYYGTDTRLAPLLVGAALAFVWVPLSADLPAIRQQFALGGRALLADGAVLAGLAVLAVTFVVLDDGQPILYQGGFAIVALVTAVVIAGVVHPASVVGPRILDAPPMRWVGERSYGIYLWHWPIFVLTRPQLDVPLDALPDLAPRLVLTILLADVSYRFVETPIRGGALGRLWERARTEWAKSLGVRRRLAAGGVLATTVALTLGVAVEVAEATPPPTPAYLAVPAVHGDFGVRPAAAAARTTADSTASAASAGPEQSTSQSAPASPRSSDAHRPSSSATTRPTTSPRATVVPGKSTAVPASPGSRSATPRPHPSAAAGNVTPPPQAPILAIGDSVMIGAAPQLAQDLGPIEIDAVVGRFFQDGAAILAARRAAGTLPPTVIVHLGNNGRFYRSDFDRMMAALSEARLVVFVNLKVPRDWESPDNQTLAAGVQRYPNAVLVDWRDAASGHPQYFWDDGFHVRPQGAAAYAALVARAVHAAG